MSHLDVESLIADLFHFNQNSEQAVTGILRSWRSEFDGIVS